MLVSSEQAPIIIMSGISPDDFLQVRNSVLLRGFYLYDWEFNGDDRLGSLSIGGVGGMDLVPIQSFNAVRKSRYKEKAKKGLQLVLTLAARKADTVICASDMASFNTMKPQKNASPKEFVEHLFSNGSSSLYSIRL